MEVQIVPVIKEQGVRYIVRKHVTRLNGKKQTLSSYYCYLVRKDFLTLQSPSSDDVWWSDFYSAARSFQSVELAVKQIREQFGTCCRIAPYYVGEV